MLTKTRRLALVAPGAWALAMVLLAPAAAHAQQSGLFPLHWIRRERTPCENEDPTFRRYRHEYYGYHPTCWTRFPSGWGCTSPEAPDEAKAFRDRPRDKSQFTGPAGDEPAGPEGAMGGPEGAEPAPPGGATIPPLPEGSGSPLQMDPKAGAGAEQPPADPQPAAPESNTGTLPIDGSNTPAPPAAPRAGATTATPGDDFGPRLTPPDPNVAPTSAESVAPAARLSAPRTPASASPGAGPGEPYASGFQPAKRKSFLNRLFTGQVFNR